MYYIYYLDILRLTEYFQHSAIKKSGTLKEQLILDIILYRMYDIYTTEIYKIANNYPQIMITFTFFRSHISLS